MELFDFTKYLPKPPEIYTLVILKYSIVEVKDYEECTWINNVPMCVIREAVQRSDIIFIYELDDCRMMQSVKLRLGQPHYKHLHRHLVDCLVEYHMVVG
jgi:hypothetical protein